MPHVAQAVAHAIARATGWISRRLGRGGGTTLPGVVLLKLRPHAAAELSRSLVDGSLLISATNGKTTTARLICSAADDAGMKTVANPAGSNLLRGITTALLNADRDAELGIFEVDEAALPAVVDQLKPRTIVLMNLFRDQLDRYGELETLVQLWHRTVTALPDSTRLVLNADDPAVAYLGDGRPNTTYFGLDDTAVARDVQGHAADSDHCPRCDHQLDYSMIGMGHLGHWSCPNCGLARPRPAYRVSRVKLDGAVGFEADLEGPETKTTVRMSLPGLHNAYNAVAAVAAAEAIGVSTDVLATSLENTPPAFGRGETIHLQGRQLLLLLAKNPTGVNENIRTILNEPGDLNTMILLNDRTADGQDISWIWDVDFEDFFDHTPSIVAGGDRAHDLALRLEYGGYPRDRIIIEREVSGALDAALQATPAGATLYVLPTYTAMLDLRQELGRRGAAQPFWEDG
ncbi:MAG: MurT ligase domain-containing protein [Acidimicrobiales bacterium]